MEPSATKKKEKLPFATRLMYLEVIMLNKISQRQILYHITYMWNPNKTHTHRKREVIFVVTKGGMGSGGIG